MLVCRSGSESSRPCAICHVVSLSFVVFRVAEDEQCVGNTVVAVSGGSHLVDLLEHMRWKCRYHELAYRVMPLRDRQCDFVARARMQPEDRRWRNSHFFLIRSKAIRFATLR